MSPIRLLPTIMKNIFAIIISLMIGHSVFGQKAPKSYVNNERAKDSSAIGIDWDERISEITLTSQTEFEFRSFPMTSSCLTWREYNGTWKRKNDTLIFSDQYDIIENDTRLKFSSNANENNYLLKFNTDRSSILGNKSIIIELVYDFESGLKSTKLNLELDNKISLKIPFENIPNREELASFRYEYELTNGDKRYGYITENNTVNVKEKKLPNFIEVTIVENPKKETIYRTTKAIIDEKKLKIISIERTESDLPDHIKNIAFKESYGIENGN